MPKPSKWFYAVLLSASLLIIAVCLVCAPRVLADDTIEQQAIISLMKGTFHRPDAPLQVYPVAISGDAGIAGWTQGEMGGRAFLRKRKGAWAVILCSGDQLKEAETLVTAGLQKPQADALAAKLAEAEKAVPAERLALFTKFDGLVRIEHGAIHPPQKH